MHPQLSPVAAQMRLHDLPGRHQDRLVPRRARAPRSFGWLRSASRSPAFVAAAPAPIAVVLPDCRACSDAVRTQYVA